MSRPIIAILRGVQPAEAVAISGVILAAGIDKIEVPLSFKWSSAGECTSGSPDAAAAAADSNGHRAWHWLHLGACAAAH